MNLYEFYKLNFILRQEHEWDIDFIESMMPFERDVYVGLLVERIQKKLEQQRRTSS
jgi:hypothetical protein